MVTNIIDKQLFAKVEEIPVLVLQEKRKDLRNKGILDQRSIKGVTVFDN